MRLEIEIGGRTRIAEVQRNGNRYVVALDGRNVEADVIRSGDRYSLVIGSASFEVTVSPASANGDLQVHVDGVMVPVSVSTHRGSWGRKAHGAASGHGPQRVSAPMPGKVVKVLVKPGDVVAARQGLVVVEAMKMENELRSPKAGTVAEVRVAEGASVEAGTVLVIVE